MNVRAAELSDAVALGWLTSDGLTDAPSSGRGPEDLPDDPVRVGTRLVERAMARGHRLLVLESGGGLAGVARVAPRELLRSRHVGDLELLVHPTVRGRGFGRRLAEAAVEMAVGAPDLQKLAAHVAADDPALRASLLRAGPWALEWRESLALRRGDRLVDLEFWGLWVDGEAGSPAPANR